jgi:hypothetical protein
MHCIDVRNFRLLSAYCRSDAHQAVAAVCEQLRLARKSFPEARKKRLG